MASSISQPIIIGSGLTGTAISSMLSGAGVSHVLIGGPPNTLPRLGESLNLEGTLDLLGLFPQFSEYFYAKKVVVGYVGEHVFSCNFDVHRAWTARLLFKLLGYQAPREFLQVDRLGFDAALFTKVTGSPLCVSIASRVTKVNYDSVEDAIGEVQLDDGRVLAASYVFDATNHGRLLGKAAGVRCDYLSDLQRVAYTHYRNSESSPMQAYGSRPWDFSTSVVRLYSDVDAIDGIAWYIPLGSYVSVGISVRADHADMSDDELLSCAVRAFECRGLHFRDRYRDRAPTMGLTHRYFVHDRAFGANWMLAGPAYAQVWWMAGAGVGTAFAAAQVADRILREPRKVGLKYQAYMQQLIGIHETFEWFATTDPSLITPKGISKYSDRFVRTNLRRLAGSTRLHGNPLSAAFGYLAYQLFKREDLIRNYCQVYGVRPAEQTDLVFGMTRGDVLQSDEVEAVGG